MRYVIALGGNALLQRSDRPDAGDPARPRQAGRRATRAAASPDTRCSSATATARRSACSPPRVRRRPAAALPVPARHPRRPDPGHDRLLARPGTGQRRRDRARSPSCSPRPSSTRTTRLRRAHQVHRPDLHRGPGRGVRRATRVVRRRRHRRMAPRRRLPRTATSCIELPTIAALASSRNPRRVRRRRRDPGRARRARPARCRGSRRQGPDGRAARDSRRRRPPGPAHRRRRRDAQLRAPGRIAARRASTSTNSTR